MRSIDTEMKKDQRMDTYMRAHTRTHRLLSQVEILRLPQWTQLPWYLGKFIFLFWDSSLWRNLDILCQTLACLVSQPQMHRIPWLPHPPPPYLLEALSGRNIISHKKQALSLWSQISPGRWGVFFFFFFSFHQSNQSANASPCFSFLPKEGKFRNLFWRCEHNSYDLMSHSQK